MMGHLLLGIRLSYILLHAVCCGVCVSVSKTESWHEATLMSICVKAAAGPYLH